MTIEAKDSAKGLAKEAGGHRIQRIPPTERRGRVHTSTVTVAVLLPGEQSTTAYDQRGKGDFSYRWFSGTGAGGQHRNKVQNCLELSHGPTGLSVVCQGRSRAANERDAMAGLLAKLDRAKSGAHHSTNNDVRADQIGSGMRGDKIRTYRFRDDIITDHRTGKSCTCKSFMRGDIEKLW